MVPAEAGARDANNGGMSANGVRANGQNNFLLNGVDNNVNTIDFLNQTSYAIGPSVEAIGEMTVLTNGYNAEYGRGAGVVVNVNLKSGTNQLHGSLFEVLQNKDLDANPWNNNLAGAPRGPFVGQSVRRNAGRTDQAQSSLFMFGDYQGTRIASSGGAVAGLGRSGFLQIPTAAMKNGDFSSLLGTEHHGERSFGQPGYLSQGCDFRSDDHGVCDGGECYRERSHRHSDLAHDVPRQHYPGEPFRPRVRENPATVSEYESTHSHRQWTDARLSITSRRAAK